MVSAPRQQRSSGVHSPTAVAAAGENRGRGGIEALHAVKPQSVSGIIVSQSARPNHSLKRSANGQPPGPVWRYAVHFRPPGPGVLPLSPA